MHIRWLYQFRAQTTDLDIYRATKECRSPWEFVILLEKNAVPRRHLSIDRSENFGIKAKLYKEYDL